MGCGVSKPPASSELNCLWTVVAENREQPLDSVSRPAPGAPLVLRVASPSKAGFVLVATFEGGTLAQNPPPELRKIPASGEDSLAYSTPAGNQSSKVFTAFFAEDAPEVAELKQLLAQVSQQKDGKGPAAQRLYSRLSDWKGEDRTGSASAGQKVVELGASISTSSASPERGSRPGAGAVPLETKSKSSDNAISRPLPPAPVAPLLNWRDSSQRILVGDHLHPVLVYNFEPKGR